MGRKPKVAKLVEETVPKMTENSDQPCKSNPDPNIQIINRASLFSKKKASKYRSAIIRRSERLQNTTPPTRNQEIQTVIEEIDLIDSDEEDQPHVEQNLPEPPPGQKSLEEKVDYLLKTVEDMKSKATKRQFSSKSAIDLKYRSLYVGSQKKVETLTDENNQLSKKLEIASEKLETFEKWIHVCTELMEKFKDVILVSNLAKATEKALNLSSLAIHGGVSSLDAAVEPQNSAAKRKKIAKESKKK